MERTPLQGLSVASVLLAALVSRILTENKNLFYKTVYNNYYLIHVRETLINRAGLAIASPSALRIGVSTSAPCFLSKRVEQRLNRCSTTSGFTVGHPGNWNERITLQNKR